MLFMGEESGASTPFLYFVDFAEEPGSCAGRARGPSQRVRKSAEFASSGTHAIPDPNSPETFNRSRLNLAEIARPKHARVLDLTLELLW